MNVSMQQTEAIKVFSGLEYKQQIVFNRPFFPQHYSIFILKSGRVVFRKALQQIELSTPLIAFFNATSVYEYLEISDDLDGYVISIPLNFFKLFSNKFNILKLIIYLKNSIGKAYHLPEKQLEEIMFLVSALHRIIKNDTHQAQRNELTEHLFYCIILAISDYLYRTDEIEIITSREELFTLTFLKNVETYFRQQKDVAFYASRQCVTVRHLSFVVKKTMGKTSLQIINEFLIKETMTLLADTDNTIAYIADNLGFADSQSLYHFFKRNTGYTPTQYRNQLLGKL